MFEDKRRLKREERVYSGSGSMVFLLVCDKRKGIDLHIYICVFDNNMICEECEASTICRMSRINYR